MSTNAAMFVLVALVALQGVRASDFDGELEALKGRLENLVNATQVKFQEIQTSAEAQYNEIIQKSSSKLANIIDVLDKAIQAAKEQAAAVGANINACLADMPTGKDILKNATLEIASCVTDEIKKAKAIGENIISQVKQIGVIFNQTQNALKECESHGVIIGASLCKSKVLFTAGEQATAAAVSIALDIAQARKLITSITVNLELCAQSKALQIGQQMGALGIKLAVCVAEKIKQ